MIAVAFYNDFKRILEAVSAYDINVMNAEIVRFPNNKASLTSSRQ